MGILSRFTSIMEANVNALLDKCEDPVKMIDQTLRDLNESLVEVKKETATVMAEEKRCKDEVDELKAEVEKWNTRAKKALSAGNEDDARTFLSKKQSVESKYNASMSVYTAAKANADKMRKMHDKLMADIKEMESQRTQLKATASVAKSQERVNKMMSSVDTSGSMSAFDRYKDRINSRLDTAEAMAELSEEPIDEAEALANKYDSGESSSAVDAELEALKREMGI